MKIETELVRMRKAYRRADRAYAIVLALFAVLFFVVLWGAVAVAERGLLSVNSTVLVFLALAAAIYVAAGRVADWSANRVLRNAGMRQ